MDLHGISNFIGTNRLGETSSTKAVQNKLKEKEKQAAKPEAKFDKVEISEEGRAAIAGKSVPEQSEVGIEYNASGEVYDKQEEDINDAMASFFGS